MEKKFKRTLVTCALPYANGPVHIGHLAFGNCPELVYVSIPEGAEAEPDAFEGCEKLKKLVRRAPDQ